MLDIWAENMYNNKVAYDWRQSRGSIAQLGEHLPYKQGVIGSSPIVPTNNLPS